MIKKIAKFQVSFFSGLLFILHLQISSFAAKSQADFLIIENPDAYMFLNEYQQPFSESDRKKLLPYTPLQILSTGELLGDQITSAAKFTFNNKTLYIPVNEKHQRIQVKKSWEKVFNSCSVYNDTVAISKAITGYVRQFGGSETHTIKKESVVKRIFKYQSLWYVATVGANSEFFWCQCDAEVFTTQKAAPKAHENNNDIQEITDKINTRLLNANEHYKRYFQYFNTKTLQQKAIPYWTVIADKQIIRCTLNGSQTAIQGLEQSTGYITNDIEHLLLGMSYSAEYSQGVITISPRSY